MERLENHLVLTQNNLCRTCTTPEINLTSLFNVVNVANKEEALNSILLKCTSIQVTSNDVYPQYICDSCIEKLTSAYLFREQCYQAHERLGQLYESGNVLYSCLKEDNSLTNQQPVSEPSRSNNVDLLYKDFVEKNEIEKIETLDEHDDFQNCDNQYNNIKDDDIENYSNENDYDITTVIKHYDHDDVNQTFIKSDSCDPESNKDSPTLTAKFSCSDCTKVFCSKYAMHRHMKVHSSSDELKCSICNKQFTRASDVKRHMSSHTGEKPYSCVVCRTSFTQSGSLAIHMRKHEDYEYIKKVRKRLEDRPHLCSICGMSFKHSSSLTIHVRRHIGEKPYGCNICNMRFVSSGRLTSHKRVHTGERPFPCNFCGKRFAQSSVAGKHMKSHSDIRPYQCQYCLKTFSTLYYLNIHKRQHTGEKPHECNVCHKTFADPKNLKQHKNIHTEEKPYLCIICGKSFRRSHHLKSHMNIHANGS